jgi:hypothetical protein
VPPWATRPAPRRTLKGCGRRLRERALRADGHGGNDTGTLDNGTFDEDNRDNHFRCSPSPSEDA